MFQPTDLKSLSPHVMFGKLQALIEGLIKDVPYVDLEVRENEFFSGMSKRAMVTKDPNAKYL